ncbi:MAG TPA: aminotransferase class I/II-fold pyridoxal phosphate-dependent enzyme [Chloroflexi bacterium]|nr:aminotransferase class I/II-fold pyridoxal phosphate-dependent enzyme [Chloroflexota bacterium]
MATFQPFAMERMMSKWENVVAYNLSESGVHPITVRALVDDPAAIEELLTTELNYPQTNGIIELRERIAALYPGATADNVLVTVGCAEANFVALQTLLMPGDEMVMMLPNYMQIWGISHNLGIQLKPFHLREEQGWSPDLDELSDVVSEKTKLIAVCNPNNPTGYILSEAEMDDIVAAAARVGAWLLADEVYSGAERLTDTQTPSFWGRYNKVLAMNSLSKAYGLPGLRIGWVVAPADTVDELWARHEYTTISTTMLSNRLAAIALSPQVRPRLIRRARDYIRRGFPILDGWLESHEGTFTLIPPRAAAIAFARYNLDVNSTDLVERLICEKGVLIVPGDHFGLDHYLRISFGLPPDYLRAGLDRIHELIVELERRST